MHRKSSQDEPILEDRIHAGLQWLVGQVNEDGGWGDTTISHSNISTTALCWAAFGAASNKNPEFCPTVEKAEGWLVKKAGSVEPDQIAKAILNCYGKDRTFSVPILTLCALAGKLGTGRSGWRHVLQLPFELAAFPGSWFAALKLPVVSYALPALIAIGQVVHFHRPSRNPLLRFIRNAFIPRTLRKLIAIQPENGGFLEATPLTSFVVMSLAGCELHEHPVAQKGLQFLLESVRDDGSWPIDTNLSTWVTTLSVNALSVAPDKKLKPEISKPILDQLLDQQYRVEHPYTLSAPGGWAWTDLPGGVPDADDTSGALLALRNIGLNDTRVPNAAAAGIDWLKNIQNGDGGIPTFCRGWGTLPFDRSSPDITGHVLRAWLAWSSDLSPELKEGIQTAIPRAVKYLQRIQRTDGAWMPLWFGNQHNPEGMNLTYGTSRVLVALNEVRQSSFECSMPVVRRGYEWLVAAQNPDGSWSGSANLPASVEETALAVEALAVLDDLDSDEFKEFPVQSIMHARRNGVNWLLTQIENGKWIQPSPIGLYFAQLWYYEALYPVVFTVAALNRMAQAKSD